MKTSETTFSEESKPTSTSLMLDELSSGLAASAEIRKKQRELERQGALVWLKTLFPFAFEESFSVDHTKFWTLYFSLLLRIREQQKFIKLGIKIPERFLIKPDEYVYLLLWGRGLGKSATLEASAVMRGAILDGGYCLYISEAQDQANEHVGNCRDLIENEESRLAEFYPGMTTEIVRSLGGKRDSKRAEDIFITQNGWICRAKGLNSRLRGLRIGKRRPDDILVDDVDGVNDSIAVAVKKLKQLTASVFPTQARRHATIKFGQNLIHENSTINQIFTGKSDALAERTVIGVTNTFVNFDYETYTDTADGRVKYRILPTSVTTWSGVDLEAAQKFLFDSGFETFMAEYQNSFDHLKKRKMIYNYDEKRHLITWDMFESVFGVRHIPKGWAERAASDIGYSASSLAGHVFAATSAMNTSLPNKKFVHRVKTFDNVSIDDQAIALWQEMFPDQRIGKRHFEASTDWGAYPELLRLLRTKPECAPHLVAYLPNPLENRFDLSSVTYDDVAEHLFHSQIEAWFISHEKSGEQKTLVQKYGLPIQKTKHFGKESGVAEWNALLYGDFTRPHPFQPDELDIATGLYKLGCPELFYIVENDAQLKSPKNDAGLKNHRENLSSWERINPRLTETGWTKADPMKFQRDTLDAERMIWATGWGGAAAAPRSDEEEFGHQLKHKNPHLTPEAIANESDPEQKSQKLLSVTLERERFYKEQSQDYEKDNAFAEMYNEQGLGDEDFGWLNNL